MNCLWNKGKFDLVFVKHISLHIFVAQISSNKFKKTENVWAFPAQVVGNVHSPWLTSSFSCLSQSRELARQLVEFGHKGTVLSREEFEEKKATTQAAEAAKNNAFYNRRQTMWVNLLAILSAFQSVCITNRGERNEHQPSVKYPSPASLLYSKNFICPVNVWTLHGERKVALVLSLSSVVFVV